MAKLLPHDQIPADWEGWETWYFGESLPAEDEWPTSLGESWSADQEKTPGTCQG